MRQREAPQIRFGCLDVNTDGRVDCDEDCSEPIVRHDPPEECVPSVSYGLWWACVAEFVGTFFVVHMGCAAVAMAVTVDAFSGLFQVAIIWGLAVAVAIHMTSTVSGAHLNPAVSLALTIFRPEDFSRDKLIPYWISQLVGGIMAGLVNFIIYSEHISHYENENEIERGTDDSIRSAMMFGEYFPNPGFDDGTVAYDSLVGTLRAFLVEAWGTAILVYVIFALTDKRNSSISTGDFTPYLIGMTVTLLICIYAPITQAGWNPARDFGPRIVAAIAGWGSAAIPGPHGGFWVYIFGPMLGGVVGGGLYQISLNRALSYRV
eukprot:TRINITY_DN3843_c0_g1_i3.p1 TRINITY_DN3843_c0_g1~~TRINITY_DN3843_c0_g1_i3.p1  ORF type:complete len:319 (+),score=49.86 TRINITY_DN3843_c0_g1_i3:43-999(+)